MQKHLPLVLCLFLCAMTMVPKGPSRPAASGPVADALARADWRHKMELRRYYHDLADATERDGGKRIVTLAQWRAANRTALGIAFEGTDLPKKYPGLDTAVETVLQKGVGLQDRPLVDIVGTGQSVAQTLAANCREVEAQCE